MRDFLIVYAAELKRRLRSRAFQIGLIVGVLGVAGMIKLPSFVESHVGVEQQYVALAGAPALVAQARTLLENDYTISAVRASTSPPSEADLAAMHAGRMIALDDAGGSLHVIVYATSPQISTARIAELLVPLNVAVTEHLDPQAAHRAVTVPVEVHGVGKTFASPQAAAFAKVVGFSLLIVLYLVVILNSQLTLTSVIEEKTNRIAELLVAAIDPLALLYGKIFAGTTLALIQMVAWVIVGALVGGSSAPSPEVAGGTPGAGGVLAFAGGASLDPMIAPAFLFLLLVGLLQFSTIYAAIGSLVSRPEDLGSISSALIFPIVAAFITAMLALDAPNAPFVVAASFVPMVAPFVMFVRIVMGQPPAWQLALCAAINLLALWGIAIAASRLYRVGMLLYGRPPSLAQIWKTVRQG